MLLADTDRRPAQRSRAARARTHWPRDRRDGYIPLFWRLFIPNAAVLTAACIVLVLEPANGQVVGLAGGLILMLAVNVVLMRRAADPLVRVTEIMRAIDPLRPGQRLPDVTPVSEVTVMAEAFNEMLDRIESERRESARRQAIAEEAERRLVASELHDQIGQTLTGMKFQINRAVERSEDGARGDLIAVRDAVEQTIEDVRRLATRLRPEVLDTLGLAAAVTNLCDRVRASTGLRVIPRVERDLPALTGEAELALYRVAQESLTNAARHAGASRAVVELRREGDDVVLRVADDGRGLTTPFEDGNGIRGMRERAVLVGAALRIDTMPGAGVEVSLTVPGSEVLA